MLEVSMIDCLVFCECMCRIYAQIVCNVALVYVYVSIESKCER